MHQPHKDTQCPQQVCDSSTCCLQVAVASAIVKQDGFGALYRGLSAGLLRQATYTTARLGIFQGLSDYLKKRNDGKVPRLSYCSLRYDRCTCPVMTSDTAPGSTCVIPSISSTCAALVRNF